MPFVDALGGVRGLNSVTVTSVMQEEVPGSALPGAWQDDDGDVCFNVSLDGTRLTSEGSTCPDGNSLILDLQGFNVSGLPCDVDVRSNQEVRINPVSRIFELVEKTEDASALGLLSTAYVYGDFKDPVLLNVGGAATYQKHLGLCTGGWVDAPPAAPPAP